MADLVKNVGWDKAPPFPERSELFGKPHQEFKHTEKQETPNISTSFSFSASEKQKKQNHYKKREGKA